ncbi:flavin reductase [Actinocorallia longicatena]|uniref:Flavin reductase like domain-containing protein n=1 Tax=Actinocorallia longicatena TaxID=111803 RepID=A0ABP6Q3V9_9ACTN
MAVDAETFRSALGQWPTGVALVTTVSGDGWHGMTASSLTSVSLDPPLVLVCLDHRIHTHELVSAGGVFAVSVLGKDQAVLGQRFAGRHQGDRFADAPWRAGPTGSPVLETALSWLDCRVVHAYPGGDHTIFVGEIVAAGTPRRTAPLLFHSRSWGQLADPLPTEITVADTGLAAALRGRGLPAAALLEAVRAANVRTRVALPGGPAGHAAVSVLVDDPAELDGHGRAEIVEFRYRDRDHAEAVAGRAAALGARTAGRIADAFAGDGHDRVLKALAELAAAGCDEIALDEGPPGASPLRVRELLQDAMAEAAAVPVRVRFTEQGGLGLANALTAMKSGVRHFDATLGGVDGGLCTADVLYLAERLEVASPADRTVLVRAAAELATVWGAPLPARTYRIPSGRTTP